MLGLAGTRPCTPAHATALPRCAGYTRSRRFSPCCWSCFFFFQAEDGIRDLTVTGVQTCALPILKRILIVFTGGLIAFNAVAADAPDRPLHALYLGSVSTGGGGGGFGGFGGSRTNRSGERRGGEEGRSRGGADHLKKKKEQCTVRD